MEARADDARYPQCTRSGIPPWKRGLTTPDIRNALEVAFRRSAKELELGEPLDWMETRHPRRWRFGSEIHTYDWK